MSTSVSVIVAVTAPVVAAARRMALATEVFPEAVTATESSIPVKSPFIIGF